MSLIPEGPQNAANWTKTDSSPRFSRGRSIFSQLEEAISVGMQCYDFPIANFTTYWTLSQVGTLTGRGVMWRRADTTDVVTWMISLLVMLSKEIMSSTLIVYKIGADFTFIERNSSNMFKNLMLLNIFILRTCNSWIVLVGIVMWCESGWCNSVTCMKRCITDELNQSEKSPIFHHTNKILSRIVL